jgi:hypothetical protein
MSNLEMKLTTGYLVRYLYKEKNEMNGKSSRHVQNGKCMQNFGEEPEGKRPLG